MAKGDKRRWGELRGGKVQATVERGAEDVVQLRCRAVGSGGKSAVIGKGRVRLYRHPGNITKCGI